tara:strand:- start:995 stop:1288 length:294 start_codon:yes stop_codon:yes gene_type:complete
METQLNQEEQITIAIKYSKNADVFDNTFDLLGLKHEHIGMIYHSMKDKANALVNHYYGEHNGWMEFIHAGFDDGVKKEDQEFLNLFCKISGTYTDWM